MSVRLYVCVHACMHALACMYMKCDLYDYNHVRTTTIAPSKDTLSKQQSVESPSDYIFLLLRAAQVSHRLVLGIPIRARDTTERRRRLRRGVR